MSRFWNKMGWKSSWVVDRERNVERGIEKEKEKERQRNRVRERKSERVKERESLGKRNTITVLQIRTYNWEYRTRERKGNRKETERERLRIKERARERERKVKRIKRKISLLFPFTCFVQVVWRPRILHFFLSLLSPSLAPSHVPFPLSLRVSLEREWCGHKFVPRIFISIKQTDKAVKRSKRWNVLMTRNQRKF